jgi:hypothetical protein
LVEYLVGNFSEARRFGGVENQQMTDPLITAEMQNNLTQRQRLHHRNSAAYPK